MTTLRPSVLFSFHPLSTRLLVHRSTIVDFSQEGDVVFWLLLALPNIVGAISCLDGSMETLKETCNWDSIRRCAPEAPPIPIARTEVHLCALDGNADVLFRFGWCWLVACLFVCGSLLRSLPCAPFVIANTWTLHTSRRSNAWK